MRNLKRNFVITLGALLSLAALTACESNREPRADPPPNEVVAEAEQHKAVLDAIRAAQ